MNGLVAFLLIFPLFIMAVVVHEVSHGWVAEALGDPTARRAGRLTLNPLKHVDPVGTVLLPLFLQLIHAPFLFGWAKPVPINFFNLRHPKRDMLWIGAVGPLSNFLMAIAAALLIRWAGPFLHPVAVGLLRYLTLINLVLGTFNLLPVPPLDGSRVLAGLLPGRWAAALLMLERWGIVVVVLLLYLGVVDRILWPVVGWMARCLGLSF